MLCHPIVRLCIRPLEAHGLCHRLVHKGHGQCNHCPVAGHIPTGFHTVLDHIQLIKGVKQGQILLRLHRFFLDKMVLWQIYRLIIHKGRRGGQGRHQAQQPIVGNKFQDCLFYLWLRAFLAVHHQHPHIQSIQHNVRGFLEWVIDIRPGILCRGDVFLPVLACFDFIAFIPHPMGTGLLKKCIHNANPSFRSSAYQIQSDHSLSLLLPRAAFFFLGFDLFSRRITASLP